MEIVAVLELTVKATQAAETIGLTIHEVLALQNQAKLEGRELDASDLQKLHDEAQSKIGLLKSALDSHAALAETPSAPSNS